MRTQRDDRVAQFCRYVRGIGGDETMKSTILCLMAAVVAHPLVVASEPGIPDKKMEAKTVVLADCDAEPFAFSFRAKDKVRLTAGPAPVVDMDFDIILDLPHGLAANNKSIARNHIGSGGIIDMGRTSLEDVKEAPREGYRPTLKPEQIVPEHTYCVLASDGKHYGKFHVVKFNPERGPIEFSWEYQPKDTNKFGVEHPQAFRVVGGGKEWLKFFAGKWRDENRIWTESGGWTKVSETRETELLVNGNALLDKRTTSNGESTVVVLGWDPSKKVLVETAYTSWGLTWTGTYDSISDDSISGKTLVGLPDGSSAKGRFTLRCKDGSSFTVEWEFKTSKGEVVKGDQTVSRK
jgi:hypothetical protein